VRVGVTGSTGFIGAALADELARRGDEVVRFVRPDTVEVSASVVRWDPRRGEVDDVALNRLGGFDAVVHLAGAGIGDHRWSEPRKDEILRSRTESTQLLVRALADSRVGTRHFASGSAIGYYGSRADEILDEHSPPGDDFLAGVCRAWEQSASPLASHGTTVSLLRTGIVLSPSGGALRRQLPLFRLGLGGVLGSGRQWLSPISLDDEVRAILWVIDHALSGPVNLVAPTPLTNARFTRELGRALGRPTFTRVPAVTLHLALGTEAADSLVLSSQRVAPRALEASGFSFAHPDAQSILGAVLTRPRA
jgi:uncharacterized protein